MISIFPTYFSKRTACEGIPLGKSLGCLKWTLCMERGGGGYDTGRDGIPVLSLYWKPIMLLIGSVAD